MFGWCLVETFFYNSKTKWITRFCDTQLNVICSRASRADIMKMIARFVTINEYFTAFLFVLWAEQYPSTFDVVSNKKNGQMNRNQSPHSPKNCFFFAANSIFSAGEVSKFINENCLGHLEKNSPSCRLFP